MTGMNLRWLMAPATAALIVLIVAAPALAHPKVVSTTPADGSTVSQPPGEVEVEFDELVENANLEVYDPCGARVDNGSPQVLGTTVTVGMFGDKAGTYTAAWEVIGEDGHPVRGDWTFTSSGGVPCPGAGGGGANGGGGGSGGGNGGASSTSGAGSAPGTAASGDDGSGSVASAGQDGRTDSDDKGRGKNGRHGKKGRHANHHGSGDEPRRVDLAADDPTGDRDSELPLDWLLISFAIAALIGAAGGAVYASIVSPR